MRRELESGIQIREENDVCELIGVAEQQFALVLLRYLRKTNDHYPKFQIDYESTEFSHKTSTGKTEGTVPDFRIRKINEQGEIISESFVEITTAVKNGTDPKKKQRRVMEDEDPRPKYVVLYRNNLQNVQAANPNADFFGGRKFRPASNSYGCEEYYVQEGELIRVC